MVHVRRWLSPEGPHAVVRLLVMHWILGVAVGVLCASLVLWLDVGGLRSLLFRSGSLMPAGLLLLYGGFAVTFGGVVCASAVMTVPVSDRDPGGGRAAICEGDAASYVAVERVPNRVRQMS